MIAMNAGLLALLLVFLPVLMGLLSLAARKISVQKAVVGIMAITMVLLSLALFWEMYSTGADVLSFDADEILIAGVGIPISLLIAALDFALMAYFIFIGVQYRNTVVIIFGLLQLIPLGILEAMEFGHTVSPSIVIDYLAVIMALVISIVGSIIIVYALKYMDEDQRQARFFAVMTIFLGAMNGAVFSNNLLWLFFFWEVTTLCCFLLIRHERTKEANESALRALIYTLGGGVAFAFAIVLIFTQMETLSLEEVLVSGGIAAWAIAPVALMALAAFTKAAQVPFQSWLLGAMIAPTPVSALLHSSTMVKLGVYLLIRISPAIAWETSLMWLVASVGAISFLGTAILAVMQTNAKRVLAYSTIGNLGLIIMCVGINTSFAISAAIVLLIFHAVSKALLFMTVGVVKHEAQTLDIEEMENLRCKLPFVAGAMLIGIFTIMLPPFGMFAGKWLIVEAASSGFPIVILLLAIGSAVTALYYAKWMGRIMTVGATCDLPAAVKSKLSKIYKITLGALVACAIALSLLIFQVVQYLVNPYILSVFGETPLSDFEAVLPLIVMLVLFGGVVLLTMKFVKIRPDMVSTSYMGGENFEYKLAGAYYDKRVPDAGVTYIFNFVATIVVVAMLMVALLTEVI
ncbi:MAG: proton-conducting transporter membrane subunit [Thermoplasmata archaeon]|nr:proton-conducting transporter membrane subunit [Thermoplasmata archaeon]